MQFRPPVPWKTHIRRGVLAAWVGLSMLAAAAAGPAAPVAVAERSYRIPPGPLSSTLARFAADAGILFAADGRLTDGKSSPGLDGIHSLSDGFARLLAGTGLEAVYDGRAYTLRPRTTSAEATLPAVTTRAVPEPATYLAAHSRTVSRTDTPLQEEPQSVTVITRGAMDDLGAQSLGDVVRYLPGVGIAQGEGNRDTAVFRGASSTSDFLIDGMRDDVQYYRDLYNIDRVEAVRGPNATAFGYGAVGGAINRISKVPTHTQSREVEVQLGSWQDRRATFDIDQPLDAQSALRLNGLYEDSAGYRDAFQLRRRGINPVVSVRLPERTRLTAGYEHFEDERTDDRGVPSWRGAPLPTDPATFFGVPSASRTWVRVDAVNLFVEHDAGDGVVVSNRTRYARYDKYFENAFGGTVSPSGTEFNVSAHNSRTRRDNLFNQTDVTAVLHQGEVVHTLTAGLELGRQATDSRRQTGFFSDGATSILAPVAAPELDVPVVYRTTATDPDTRGTARFAALLVQDQLRVSPQWLLVGGLRYDRLALDLDDRRQATTFATRDDLWSPRAGVVYQPVPALSLYASYAVGHQPRAGEQLGSLTPGTQALAPETFVNRELGAKWAVRPGFDATLAWYVLDRENVAVVDGSGQGALVDGQRSQGVELGVSGTWSPRWRMFGGYAYQDSRVRESLSSMAPAGAAMPHVPRHSLSWWNRVELDRTFAAGLGVLYRGPVYTSTDNTVQLPGFTRVDAALFANLDPAWRVQLNVENVFDTRYYASAHSNNNILPGSPRAVRLGVTARF